MNLFLLRHGTAEPHSDKDRNRRLTEEGRADLRAILSASQSSLAEVEALYSSPYIRAQQTAEIALGHLDARKNIQTKMSDEITPSGNPHAVIQWLSTLPHQSVMLVSHQPLIGILLDALGGFEAGRYRMGTSALAYLKCDVVAANLADLQWLKQP